MIDRFGLLPEPAKQLFAVTGVKLMATPLGIRKLDLGQSGGRITFRDKPNVDPRRIIELIQRSPRIYQLAGPDKLRIIQELPDAPARLQAARDVLLLLGARAPQ
jgi:transcription-repair coupling factor (superfamily II helicase)